MKLHHQNLILKLINSMNLKQLITIFLLLTVSISHAQRLTTNNDCIWVAYIGDHKFSKKFGVHLEYQERRAEFGLKNQQHFLRTAINYHFLPNAFVSAGYAFADTYPYGAFPVNSQFPENRIYQQLQYTSNLERVETMTRFRLEQRFSYLPILQADNSFKSAKSPTFTNRFRYFQRYAIPFRGLKIQDKSFYATVYNEFFINFGKNVQKNIFDQNRAFAGLGYKISKVGRLECGYMNQMLFKGDGLKVENNNTITLTLFANFELIKKKKE